jgi:LPXTG-site transpeptidase (sortase) family protein
MKNHLDEQESGAFVWLLRWSRIGLCILLAMVFLWVAFDTLLAGGKPHLGGVKLEVSQPGVALAAGERAPMQQLAQDLAVQKTHTGNFRIGAQGTYFFTVTNVGTGQVNGAVTVTDVLPNGLTPLQASGPGWTGCGITGQTVVCSHENLGGIPAGSGLGTVSIIVNVGQAAAPSVTNVATLANANDGNALNNSSSDATTIISADLAVTKSVAPTIVTELNPITYTVSVRNNGPSEATNVVLSDTLPSGLTFLGASPSQGTFNNGLWSVGNLVNGALATLRISARPNSGTLGQTIVNTTSGLRSDLFDYQPANDQGSASIRVRSTRLIGLVTAAGSNLPIVSANVVFTDSLSRVYNTTTGTNGWYTFTATTTSPIAPGNFSVRASRTGYQPTTIFSTITADVDNRQDLVLGTTDLAVAKKPNVTTVIPGQTITYTLAITNVGSLPASSVVITDVLPSTLTYITDTFGVAHTSPVAGTIVWRPATTLPANGYFNFRVRVQVANALPSASASIVNSVTASTRTAEANLANNTAQSTITSTGTPNIGITKSVYPSQVRTAQNATYTIVVNNTGTAMVTSATVTDQFSSYVDIISVTTTKGTATANASTRKVTVSIGSLSPSEVVTITVIVRVNNTATTNLTVSNTASIESVFGAVTSTRTSNSASFQLLASATLPGTGGTEPTVFLESSPRLGLPALISATLLGVIGLFALGYGIWASRKGSQGTGWYFKMSALFITASLVFGFVAWGIQSLGNLREISALPPMATEALSTPSASEGLPEGEEPVVMPPSQMDDLAALPDFPVPTPTVSAGANESVDKSAVTRIVLPSIGVDTEVKYVPFDGITWLIAGLQQEVAWLGDTSWPGLGSNTALAGHVSLRSGADGPFRYLERLEADDQVKVYTDENIYTYRVREKRLVEETDLSVVQATDGSQITLITCAEWNPQIRYYVQRLIVTADLEKVEPLRSSQQGN